MDKSGDNLRATKTMPWIRVTSTTGKWLSMESTTNRKKDNKYDNSVSFSQKYGNTKRSGRLGITNDADGNKDIYGSAFNDRGLRPSPTISSVQVSQGNEGLSKKTEFTIICYSLGQADVLMQYFLEPGNMVCVEWGENTPQAIAQKVALDACSVARLGGMKVIQKKRMAAGDGRVRVSKYEREDATDGASNMTSSPENGGQYDAVLGYITGGGMKYGDNESYEISVELSSVGELPAYLQHHKGLSGNDAAETGMDFTPDEIDDDERTPGQKLFMQMFNDLPSHKRHVDNYDRINEDWAINADNFINFDKTIRENMLDQLSEGAKLAGIGKNEEGKDITIMTEVPLFSNKRFLKVSLAFTILDSQSTVKQAATSDCNLTPAGLSINWRNTILSSHKNQFSSNEDFLHIPNKFSPDWDLLGVLQTVKSNVENMPHKDRFERNDVTGQLTLEENKSVKIENNGKERLRPSIIDTHPQGETEDSPKLNYFPRHDACNFPDQKYHDPLVLATKSDAYNWGFLRDLYINFDFFCDCISKSGVVTKDVYYDLLNGLSSAVNLNWDFQIEQTKKQVPIYHPNAGTDKEDKFVTWARTSELYKDPPSPESVCSDELQIVDLNFTGKSKDYVDQGIGLAKFWSRGARSPFLSSDLSLDIPGAMKSMVMAKGQSGTLSPNVNQEGKETYDDPEMSDTGLFSVMTDSVKAILNPITNFVTEKDAEAILKKEKEKIARQKKSISGRLDSIGEGISDGVAWVTSGGQNKKKRKENATMDAQSKANVEFFLNNVLIVPKIQGGDDDNPDIVNNLWDIDGVTTEGSALGFILVGGWNDSTLLKRIQRMNTQKYNKDKAYEGGGIAAQNNVPLLPIKFSFTIHGVSGMQVGSTFSIPDLPGGIYGKKVFQITSIQHTIAQDLWTTSVEGSMRNLDAGSQTLPHNPD